MSKSERAWMIAGAGGIAGSVVWLCVSPGVLAWVVLAVGLVILLVAAIGQLMPFTMPQMSLPVRPLRVGDPFVVTYRQRCKRTTDVTSIRLELVLRETVRCEAVMRVGFTNASGQETRIDTETHDEIVQAYSVGGQRFIPGQMISETRAFQIPVDAMHTFAADHNRIEWYVIAHLVTPKWGEDLWEEKLTVLPELAG